MNFGTEILGVGSSFPETQWHNSDLEKFLDTSDEWIRTRTGIQTRRLADPARGESTFSLSLGAAKKALEKAGITAESLGLILVGTVTPNTTMPSTANRLQAALGASRAFGFDLSAACSGFLYGLSIADQYIRSGSVEYALVIGAETLSTLVNWKDRSSCVLFGDGAGAAVVRRTEGSHRILAIRLHSDGNYGELLNIPHGGSEVPVYSPEYRIDHHKIHMKGREIFKLAVRNMVDSTQTALDEAGLKIEDVDYVLLHQANIRIIEKCVQLLGVDPVKTWINVDKYGNTSAATLPVCLDEAWRANKVKKGDIVLMTTFGGGLTWGAGVLRL